MPEPIRLAFLGCGFITDVHSRHLRALGGAIIPSYASRDRAKAAVYQRRFGGATSYGDYETAIGDPAIDAVVVAVPPTLHLDLVIRALAAGKHVLVEKPAFPTSAAFDSAIDARNAARRVVLVGENDHYKPQAVCLRHLLAERAVGDVVFMHFVTIAKRLKTATDWRNDERLAGGDAFFEEGVHWLHLAGSLGPRITAIRGFRPTPSTEGPDRRSKSMLAAFQYDSGAVGALYYSREIPSLLRGLRWSKIYGREGVITFESNGLFVAVRRGGSPKVYFPGLRDIRGYRAMYRDFVAAVRTNAPPEMSLERARDDQRLMDQVLA